jgi:cobalt-zinc-cadmium efflux system protein
VSALFFFRDKESDLNAKGAYLHLAVDALVSAGVVVAGIFISYTGLAWIDPCISLAIMAVVIYSTWGLLTESLRLSLDAVPQGIDLDKIRDELVKTKGVARVYHIHIWAMSTTKNALTAHVLLEKDLNGEQITALKKTIRHQLEHRNIQHATLETETHVES